nr:unnamed protein product [Digitaria exilis]
MSMSITNSFKLAPEAARLGSLEQEDHHRILRACGIQISVRFVLPGELAKHAVSEDIKVVTRFNVPLGCLPLSGTWVLSE